MTLYNIHKPRDRSHYERFRHYHETFYRSVEVSSVTPFAARALDRGFPGGPYVLLHTLAHLLIRSLSMRCGYPAASIRRFPPTCEAVWQVLHAKAVVADDESVFITSANLTAAAWDRNIEMGLLVRDRGLAATTVIHFRTLIEKDLLRRLPGT